MPGNARRIGAEFDHLTMEMKSKLETAFGSDCAISDIAPGVMRLRMIKSAEEVDLIRGGAAVADHGGWAIRDAIRVGASEIEVAQAGRDAMETEIARRYPDSELRDSWVWFQSGLARRAAQDLPVLGRRPAPRARPADPGAGEHRSGPPRGCRRARHRRPTCRVRGCRGQTPADCPAIANSDAGLCGHRPRLGRAGGAAA